MVEDIGPRVGLDMVRVDIDYKIVLEVELLVVTLSIFQNVTAVRMDRDLLNRRSARHHFGFAHWLIPLFVRTSTTWLENEFDLLASRITR